jgi:hypothetical protein
MPRKPTVARFSVSLPADLLDELDVMVRRRGFQSRSQAIAALARDGLVELQSELGTRSMAGTINLVYDYRKRNLQSRLMAIQHKYFVPARAPGASSLPRGAAGAGPAAQTPRTGRRTGHVQGREILQVAAGRRGAAAVALRRAPICPADLPWRMGNTIAQNRNTYA